jgi:hypothetical protein
LRLADMNSDTRYVREGEPQQTAPRRKATGAILVEVPPITDC